MFDLPLLIIFSPLFAFNAPLLIPLNSLVLSWMVMWLVEMFKTFRRSGRKRQGKFMKECKLEDFLKVAMP
jgi:hypothetical protein